MPQPKIINAEIRAGIWRAEALGMDASAITVTHQGIALDGVTTTPLPERDSWQITAPIPAHLINDGVQSFVVADAQGQTLASFAILAGDVLACDLRAEIDLLRAELDMLKSAFRKHVADS